MRWIVGCLWGHVNRQPPEEALPSSALAVRKCWRDQGWLTAQCGVAMASGGGGGGTTCLCTVSEETQRSSSEQGMPQGCAALCPDKRSKQSSHQSRRQRGTSACAVAQRVSYMTKVCAHTIKGVRVAYVCCAVAGMPRPHRWTTAERWSAGRGWPRASKRQAHGGVSHGHWPWAPETVPSPSWMHIYNVIYVECRRSW